MAMNMDALLRIKAAVTGNEQLTALGTKLKQTHQAAIGLTKAGGLAGSALAALAPVVTIGGLTALIGSTIKTADSMYDLSLRTGVSVEMLGKFGKAAKMNGSSLDAVVLGIGRLQKSMVAAASDNNFGQKTQEEMDRAVDAVREGERSQTSLIKEQADERVSALQRETDRRLNEIGKRYRREEQLLNDKYDDEADAADQAAQEQADRQIKYIQRQFDARREMIRADKTLSDQAKTYMLQQLEDQEDAALDVVRNGAARQAKERQRAARDSRQAVMDQLNARREQEENAIKDQLEAEKKVIKEGADYRIEQVKRSAEEAAKALKGTSNDELAQQMEELGLSGKGASRIFRELNIDIKNADGSLRPAEQVMLDIADALAKIEDPAKRTAYAMALLGRGGAELVPMLSKGGDAIEKLKSGITTELAKMADQYSDSLINLSGAVSKLAIPLVELLLPAMIKLSEGMVALVRGFSSLPSPIQSVVSLFAVAAIAATTLAAALAPLGLLLLGLAGTGLKTALLASFTGPAGWITLAVIAVGAMVIAFREPIGKFLAWVGEGIAKVAKTIGDGITGAISSAWQWLTKAVGNVAQALAEPFEVAVGGIKAAVRGVLQYVANSVNIVTGLVNSLIRGFNSLPGPDLPQIPFVTVPSFAGGGYTGSGPRAGGIDGRGGFMAMLHPQETVIDHTRGAAAALGGAATAAASAPSITIQTGPIYRLPDGTDTVSVGDLQAAMQATAAAVMGQLRRPGAQLALGIR